MLRVLRYLWASPNTLLGLAGVLLAILTGGRARIVDGAIEAHGGFISFLLRRLLPPNGVLAVTIGHTILGASAGALQVARAHEHVHVRQYEQWGPLFLPAYLVASIVAAARGGRFYRDNPFERAAYRQSGPRKTS